MSQCNSGETYQRGLGWSGIKALTITDDQQPLTSCPTGRSRTMKTITMTYIVLACLYAGWKQAQRMIADLKCESLIEE